MQARARARASITNHDHGCRRRRWEGYMARRRGPAARPRTRSPLRVRMRCWTTTGINSMRSRARAARSKHPPSTYSARVLLVHRRRTAPRRRLATARCVARSALPRLHADAQCPGCFQVTMLGKTEQPKTSLRPLLLRRASRKSSAPRLRSFRWICTSI